MREEKMRLMAEIVGGEIAALLAEARAKAEEHARLVAEQRSLVEKEMRFVEELKGMVEERSRIAERARVDDSETAVEEKRVENSRRLLAGLRNMENWGSGMFFISEKEVGGAPTKGSPEVNSVSPVTALEELSVPALSPHLHVAVSTEEAKAEAEINAELWGSEEEEEGDGEGKELNLLVEQLSAGQEEQESQSAKREETGLEQSDHALAEQMQRLEYEGDEGASMVDAILTHSDPTTVTSLPPTKALRPPPALPEATSAVPPPPPPPLPIPTSPPHPTQTSPPEVSAPSQQGRQPIAAQTTLPKDAVAVHERRFLRSSGTTWVEEVSRLAAVETTRRQVQEEQRRRQLSSWNAEVSRGIALSQQRQSALLVELQMERDRHWAEVGSGAGAGGDHAGEPGESGAGEGREAAT
ncbi:hypothetical protein BGX38DRAFT_174113 [Terfezia claveryi]|nr:hypothetical protein BGX38DRAFT_174113 [Terfezia claveryi]